MRLMLIFQLILIGLLVINIRFDSRKAPATIAQQVDAFLEQEVARNHLPGVAAAVTRGNEVLFLKGFGTADGRSPVTPRTQFYLGSLSKSFTALAVLQLVEAGKIDLDAPVRQYLPEFEVQGGDTGKILIRYLLNHTSGLADQGFPELTISQAQTPTQRVATLRRARFVAPPGTEFHYFNPNYEILARVVEVVSGQSFSEYLKQSIFAPLIMKDTVSVIHSSETAALAPHLAQGHVFVYSVPAAADELPGYIGGSGGVISTVEDLARFLILQNQAEPAYRTMISPQSLELMHTPPSGLKTNYGMGWFRQEENGLVTLEHNGVLSAYYAEMVLIPEDKIGIILLYNANSLAATALPYTQIKQGLVAILSGKQAASGGFALVHYSILMGLLTLAGIFLAIRSLVRLPQWRKQAEATSRWKQISGIAWAFSPAVALAGMPWLVAAGSGRFFGYAALARSMPEVFTWLGFTSLFGLLNGFYRLFLVGKRKS